jgi:hypothetical protein
MGFSRRVLIGFGILFRVKLNQGIQVCFTTEAAKGAAKFTKGAPSFFPHPLCALCADIAPFAVKNPGSGITANFYHRGRQGSRKVSQREN